MKSKIIHGDCMALRSVLSVGCISMMISLLLMKFSVVSCVIVSLKKLRWRV